MQGKPVKDHPVIKRLVELRVYIQKLAPLEKKLKYNIERLLAASNLNPGVFFGSKVRARLHPYTSGTRAVGILSHEITKLRIYWIKPLPAFVLCATICV